MKECPHCLTEVIVMSDGRCPSCLGDTSEEASGWSKMTITADMSLPLMCCTCDTPTNDFEKVVGTRSDRNERLAASIGIGLLSVFSAIRIGRPIRDLFLGDRDDRSWFVMIPRCKSCQQDDPMVPESVDQDSQSVVLVVSSEFKAAC